MAEPQRPPVPQRPPTPRRPPRPPQPQRAPRAEPGGESPGRRDSARAESPRARPSRGTPRTPQHAAQDAPATRVRLRRFVAKPRPREASEVINTRPPAPQKTSPQPRSGSLIKPSSAPAQPAHRPLMRSTTPTPWERVNTTGNNVTTRLQERLRERQSAQVRLSVVTWVKRIGITAAVVLVGWLVLVSPLFALDPSSAEVTGYGSVVSPEEVATVIGAHEGTSLARLDTRHMAAELEQLVGVREATITRVWPSGLRVELVSSEPVAAIPDGQGKFVLVDDRGEHVDATESEPAHLPVITIPMDAGQTRILEGVLGVIDEIPVSLRDRVEGIEAHTEDSIQFVLREGPRVEWGSGEQSALKAEVLRALLEAPQTAGAEVIDVSAPSLPITRQE